MKLNYGNMTYTNLRSFLAKTALNRCFIECRYIFSERSKLFFIYSVKYLLPVSSLLKKFLVLTTSDSLPVIERFYIKQVDSFLKPLSRTQAFISKRSWNEP